MAESHLVLVGTSKGAFVLKGAPGSEWEVSGPHCDGSPINHVIGDPKTGDIWAAGGGGWFPLGVWHRPKGGDWSFSDTGFDPVPEALWSLAVGPDRLFAGSKPANLYESRDRGATWQHSPALTQQDGANEWMPGAVGLTLHTILTHPKDPDKLWVGISAAGFFASEDGGASWERRVRRSNEDSFKMPNLHDMEQSETEIFLCVHNAVRAPGQGDLIYQQNHHGVLRSPDGGRNWTVISGDLPSHFGFPIAVDAHDPQLIYTFPLNGDIAGRYPAGAAAAVWRSRDGGENWEACRHGLPQKGCYFTVLRQAMAVDGAATSGVYFGTNSGSVFASFDHGDSWHEIARHLPTVLSVEAMVST